MRPLAPVFGFRHRSPVPLRILLWGTALPRPRRIAGMVKSWGGRRDCVSGPQFRAPSKERRNKETNQQRGGPRRSGTHLTVPCRPPFTNLQPGQGLNVPFSSRGWPQHSVVTTRGEQPVPGGAAPGRTPGGSQAAPRSAPLDPLLHSGGAPTADTPPRAPARLTSRPGALGNAGRSSPNCRRPVQPLRRGTGRDPAAAGGSRCAAAPTLGRTADAALSRGGRTSSQRTLEEPGPARGARRHKKLWSRSLQARPAPPRERGPWARRLTADQEHQPPKDVRGCRE
ncbi:hypothetical protein NDU88_008311 [Pleurodeles waltl]|uniref:Uncharacterized protein n=1 Tax=Pleurodeles waltl TaxID=8319 RepID=A0AAV7PNT7_PLEWA|nr:hypothetical protein NDU88_008311 [Pleurodeles waltl]